MSALLPAESIALTVALAQVQRGDNVDRNVGALCVLALARLDGRHDWTAAGAEADDMSASTFVLCSRCREPLVSTMEVQKKEWVCVACGRFSAFFDGGHERVRATPQLIARHAELADQWRAGRAEREAQQAAADTGSADLRLLWPLLIVTGALALLWVSPLAFALVFGTSLVASAVVGVGVWWRLWREDRRGAGDDNVFRLPPLSPEALERIRRGERSL